MNNLRQSINKGYLSYQEFQEGEYFIYKDLFYSTNKYVITLEGELKISSGCAFCEGINEYTSDPVNVYSGHKGIQETWNRNTAKENFYCYKNDYYDREAVEEYLEMEIDEHGNIKRNF